MIDPKLFNYVIMTLYVLNAGQYAWRGHWGDAWYWSGAFWITAAVTWGFSK